MEACCEFLLARFGEGANPGAQGLGLENAEGHHLAATGAAACLAGDGEAGLGQLRGDAAYQRVVKRLQDGQDLGEVGSAGGHDRGGGEFALADAHRELDRDGLLLLFIHRLRIVANLRPEGLKNARWQFHHLCACADFFEGKTNLDGEGKSP